jgi:tetratricopeptide (TPR) repeat protein
MKVRCSLLGSVLSLALCGVAHAASPVDLLASGIALLEHASQVWDEPGMVEAGNLFQQAAGAMPDDPRPQYWLGATAFQEAVFHLHARPEDRDPDQALKHVEAGLLALDRALALDPKDPESYALRGVLTGLKVQLYFWSVFALGPRIESDRNQALALDPGNPRVHYLTGMSLWFAPEIFGDRDHALTHLLQAEELFAAEAAQPADPLRPRWGQAYCLAFLGDAYAARKDPERARAYYRKALQISPQNAHAARRLAELAPATPHP